LGTLTVASIVPPAASAGAALKAAAMTAVRLTQSVSSRFEPGCDIWISL
jgi:hypothetical protein